MKKTYVNNNGILIPQDSYSIKSGNRAHLYGDGLFESMRIIHGKVIHLESHYHRLIEGMKALKMNVPNGFTLNFIQSQLDELIQENQIIDGGRIRLSIDRKAGGDYLPLSNDVDYFIETFPLPNSLFTLNEAGIKIDIYNDLKKTVNKLSNFKTKNGLIYIMAKMAAKEKGLDDMLIQNQQLGIIEASSSNLFVVRNGVLYTPGLDSGCLGGTMRMNIINLALKNNIKVYECNITPNNLLMADEVFLTNAIKGIIWVGGYRTKRYFNTFTQNLTQLLNAKF